MLSIFQRRTWPPDFGAPPWGDAQSIYAHISAHIDPEDPVGLLDAGVTLPDEAEPEPGGISFAAGALDGVVSHHGGGGAKGALASDIYRALKRATRNASDRNVRTLYDLIRDNPAIDVVDQLADTLTARKSVDAGRLHEIMRWFATGGAEREAVKFSMVLLGLLRDAGDAEIFLTLGRHDEFTLYAAVAISNNEDLGEPVLWQLAQTVGGWGRIQTVERLAGTRDPAVQAWLLREGYKNDVMYEYLACICARAGQLHHALVADSIDDALFNGACDIVETLIAGEGGPAEGLNDYEHGCAAVTRFLRHGRARFTPVEHYRVMCSVQDRVEAHVSGADRLAQDWTDDAADAILSETAAILRDRDWTSVVLEALQSGPDGAFWVAIRAGGRLGVDPWPYVFDRTAAGGDYWWDLMRLADDTRIDQVLDLGLGCIPLDEIATGPGDASGFGEAYAAHRALDFILQDLGQFPGKGWAFTEAGLASPVTRNRNLAIRALAAWGRDHWPRDAAPALDALRAVEPNDDVRGRIEDLLAGGG